MNLENFDLLITDPPSARVVASPSGDTSTPVPLEVDTEAFVERYESLLWRPNLAEEELKALGGELFQVLFRDEILDLFRESVGRVHGSGAGLRIRLRLESASLSRLPWALLFTKREDFLATNPAFTVCRYLHVPQPPKPAQVGLPLRILMVSAAPSPLPALDHEAERKIVMSAVETLLEIGGVELIHEVSARREPLLTRLQREPIHVLHFVGHGSWEGDQGLVFFETDEGQPDPLDAVAFANLLSACPSLRLVVLNACSTAQEDAHRSFSGVASQLVARGIPAVAAMRNPIEDQVAIAFAKHLYGNLASGEAVDIALTRTRQQLRLERGAGKGAFTIPILYLQAPDGSLFDIISSRQKCLVQVAQQVVQLSATSEALAEWKELHDILQMLTQPLTLVYQLAANPQGALVLSSVWAQFQQTVQSRLMPFARDRMRFIGRRYEQGADASTGEEWAVRTLELARQVDEAIASSNLTMVREAASQLRTLLFKHMTLANRNMVQLLDEVNQLYRITKDILDGIRAEDEGEEGELLNWTAIAEELSILESGSAQISEWIRLHDLFDRLHVQFATIAASASFAGSLDLIAQPWTLLRDTLVLELLEQAGKISRIGKAYAELPDGSLRGEPWALEIKRKSDQLDDDLRAHNLEHARQSISELDQTIENHYLQIDRKVRDEMQGFTERSIALQARVAP